MLISYLYLVGLFVIGSAIGSFSGVLLETRVKRSFWTGRSQCLSCSETLKWYELIPVVSYLLQVGKCRHCHTHIPRSVFFIEFLTGVLWVIMGGILLRAGFDIRMVILHLIPLSMLLILAIEDSRSFMIPDKLSLPMIFITIIIVLISSYSSSGFIPTGTEAIVGAISGMMFYILQMIIPACISVIQEKQYSQLSSILCAPFFFPFWLILKVFIGEEKADKYIPSIALIDNLPTWVGGGDVRLGIFVGLLTGPLYFWWVVGIGYTCGSLYWLIGKVLGIKNVDILPVAPLLFMGFCIMWIIRSFI